MSGKNTIVLYAELSYGDTTVTLYGTQHSPATYVTVDGIEGWYGTPDAKWDLTERSYSDGAFDLGSEDDIIYASRTVTVNVGVVDTSRANVLERMAEVSGCAHHLTRLRVVDDWSDTYVTGYATVESEATWDECNNEMTVTLECPDPRRYASEGTSGYGQCILEPSSIGITGGLYYGEDAAGLVYDLSYGDVDGESGNIGTLSNGGSSTAYPVATVYGTFDDGFSLMMTTGGTLYTVEYGRPVTGKPVVLDYRTRSATVGGSDRSRYLTSRGFHGIEPGDSATFNLQAEGSGYAQVVVQDTYM